MITSFFLKDVFFSFSEYRRRPIVSPFSLELAFLHFAPIPPVKPTQLTIKYLALTIFYQQWSALSINKIIVKIIDCYSTLDCALVWRRKHRGAATNRNVQQQPNQCENRGKLCSTPRLMRRGSTRRRAFQLAWQAPPHMFRLTVFWAEGNTNHFFFQLPEFWAPNHCAAHISVPCIIMIDELVPQQSRASLATEPVSKLVMTTSRKRRRLEAVIPPPFCLLVRTLSAASLSRTCWQAPHDIGQWSQ